MNLPKCLGIVILFAAALDAQQPAAAPAPVAAKAVLHRTVPPVSPENAYHHIIAAVPIIGTGRRDDPKRPMYAPMPHANAAARSEILSFTHVQSDDGKMAIVEFVAADKNALTAIMADRSFTVFEKGKHTKAEIETEMRKYKKNFKLDGFGATAR
jgi:hypothetical protein